MSRRQSTNLLPLSGAALLAASLLLRCPPASAAGKVNVLYAGSLVNLMEHGVGPAFDKASGDTFQGYAGGSSGLANQIKGKLRQGDVFVSASPKVNDGLMGAANGDWVSWYITFAQSPVVIGYNASSKFAADFKSKPWYQVLMEPGIKIGRTDPKLDPKGALTVTLMQQAETFYKSPGLAEKIIGAPDNSAQVLPEETLVGRLQSGQLDVGFFYSTETADAKIPAHRAAAGNRAEGGLYRHHPAQCAECRRRRHNSLHSFLGAGGTELMKEHGLGVQKLTLTGDAGGVPKDVQALLDQAK